MAISKISNLAILISSIVFICTLIVSFWGVITNIDTAADYFPILNPEGARYIVFFISGVGSTFLATLSFVKACKMVEKHFPHHESVSEQDIDDIEEINDPNERERAFNEIENIDQKDTLLLAEKYARVGDYVKAHVCLDKSEKYATELSDIRKKSTIIGKVEKMRGTIYLYHEEFDQSKLKYERARKIASDSGDDLLMSQILSCLGLLHRRLNRKNEAIKYFQESRDLKLQVDDKKGLVYVYRNLGAINSKDEKYVEADEYFREAMKFADGISSNFEKGKLLSNMAFHEIRKGDDLNLAKQYCEKSIPLKKSFQGEKRYLAYSYEAMGIIEMWQKNYIQSERYLKKSLQDRKSINDYHGMKRSHEALLELHRITGNEQEAKKEENSIDEMNIQISSHPRPFADMIEGLFENNLLPKFSRS